MGFSNFCKGASSESAKGRIRTKEKNNGFHQSTQKLHPLIDEARAACQTKHTEQRDVMPLHTQTIYLQTTHKMQNKMDGFFGT